MIKQFTCLNCGKVSFSERPDAKYCCKRCRNNYSSRKRRKQISVQQCRYNEGVRCTLRTCATCGWNPEVARSRLEKIVGRRG